MFQQAWNQVKSVSRQWVQALPLVIGGVRAVRRATRPAQVEGSVSTTDVDHARREPWKVFRTPKEVVNNDVLSGTDKKEILESWEEDAKHLAVAEAEGMSGGEPNRLAEVSDAKQEVAKRELS